MEISISPKIVEVLKLISQKTGVQQKEIIARALQLYLHHLQTHTLDEENKAWEQAGDDDLISFEHTL